LHQDCREPLGEIVVDVAGETIPFLEDHFAPLFDPALRHDAAVMQGERGLTRQLPRSARHATSLPPGIPEREGSTPSSIPDCGRRD
jgi:hypothetical protein